MSRFYVEPANIGEAFLRGRSQVKGLRQQEAQTKASETMAKSAEIDYQNKQIQQLAQMGYGLLANSEKVNPETGQGDGWDYDKVLANSAATVKQLRAIGMNDRADRLEATMKQGGGAAVVQRLFPFVQGAQAAGVLRTPEQMSSEGRGTPPREIQIANEIARLRSSGDPSDAAKADQIEAMAMREKTGKSIEDIATEERKSRFAAKMGERDAETLGAISSKASESDNMMSTLDQMEDLLDEGIPTGPLAGRLMGVKALAADLGLNVDMDVVAGQEAFEALGNQLAMRMRNPDSGFGLTGNTSDRDVRFLKSTVPTSVKTEAGNRMIIRLARSLNRHNKQVAILAEQYAEDNGSMLGWTEYLENWKNDNNAISEELAKEARSVFGKSEPTANTERDEAIEWIRSNPNADPRQIEAIKAEYKIP